MKEADWESIENKVLPEITAYMEKQRNIFRDTVASVSKLNDMSRDKIRGKSFTVTYNNREITISFTVTEATTTGGSLLGYKVDFMAICDNKELLHYEPQDDSVLWTIYIEDLQERVSDMSHITVDDIQL